MFGSRKSWWKGPSENRRAAANAGRASRAPSTPKAPPASPVWEPELQKQQALDSGLTFTPGAYDEALERYSQIERLKRQGSGRSGSARDRVNTQPAVPSEEASRLIRKLPADLSLIHLYTDFPHVLNRLAEAWNDHQVFYQVMDELLIDKRGGRIGFPFRAAVEISRLAQHYEQYVHPRPISGWDVVHNKRNSLY